MGELEPDDWVLDKLVAKCAAFICVLDRLLEAYARETEALDDYANALVVEVGHNDCGTRHQHPCGYPSRNLHVEI